MLRSIIAIWCIALGLIVIAATSGCGGCLDGDSCSSFGPSVAGSDMAQPPSPPQCSLTCPMCPTGEQCFQGTVTSNLPSFCARRCNSDVDCATDEICANLFDAMQPPICIRAGSPRGCGTPPANWHCDFATGATCKDASTLSQPFTHQSDFVCGWELVHCANGCATDHCL